MANQSIASLHDVASSPNPSCSHAVEFYDNDSVLLETLSNYVGTALAQGDTTIVVATKTHSRKLRQILRSRKINLAAAVRGKKYIELDAEEALARFMVAGVPDKEKFENTIGAIVAQAQATTGSEKRLVIYGEMVALLWAEGKRDATVRLEELWNALSEHHAFHLLCGYPVNAFDRAEHRQFFFSICGEHTGVNRTQNNSRPKQDNDGEFTSTVRLQQRAEALENEIRLGQQRVLLLQKVPKAGTWELDIANDVFSFSSAAAKVLGFSFASRLRLGQFLDLMYYSGDRELVLERLQQAQRREKEFTANFRIRSGEETRLIEMRGKTCFNAGSPIMLGVVSDVTPPKLAD